jgi:O-methyltransferase involved in polyketide biosynthesis
MTTEKIELSRVQQTLLLTLYGKALDYRSKTPVLGDHWADEVLRRIGRLSLTVRTASVDRFVPVLRAKRMDEWTREFLAGHPGATVLHLACGLDSRAFRIDVPEGVRWFDLDFPEVINLRRRFYPGRDNYRLIASSVTDAAWLDEIPTDRPVLVIAEGLVMYLTETDVKQLLQRLTDRLPHGEMIFDIMSPPIATFSSLFGYSLWGLADPHQLERWNPRLTLIDDTPPLADYEQIPLRRFRIYCSLLNKIPVARTMIRSLRYRFGPE